MNRPVTFETQPSGIPAPINEAVGRVRDRLLQAYFQNSGNPADMNASGVEQASARIIDTQA